MKPLREWLRDKVGADGAWLIPLDAVAVLMISEAAVHVTIKTKDSYNNIPVDKVKVVEIYGRTWLVVEV